MISRQNPFVGPRPLEEQDKIYGRNTHTQNLLNLLIAERIVLLLSPSGAGKTSLIQAGLIPLLEDQEDIEVFPVARVNLVPDPELESRNRYEMSLILSIEHQLERKAKEDGKTQPDLDFKSISVNDYLLQRLSLGEKEVPQMLFVDQFEEILTVESADAEDKQAFFNTLGSLLRHYPNLIGLFAMREEYLAEIEQFVRRFPTRLRTRYRLPLLDLGSAALAIKEPADQVGVEISDNAIDSITANLRSIREPGETEPKLGSYVEPVHLQVVCRDLWNKLPAATEEIRADDIREIGDVDDALASYYSEALGDVAKRSKFPERHIREWFESALIDERGFRRQTRHVPGRNRQERTKIESLLLKHYLIRSDQRLGVNWHELTHDRLVRPILRNNEEWSAQHLSALQQQAILWTQNNKSARYLISGQALDEAETWAGSHRHELSEADRIFLDESQQARSERESHIRKVRKIYLPFAVAGFVLASFVAIALLFNYQALKDARDTADAARDRARDAHARAELLVTDLIDQDWIDRIRKEGRSDLISQMNEKVVGYLEDVPDDERGASYYLARGISSRIEGDTLAATGRIAESIDSYEGSLGDFNRFISSQDPDSSLDSAKRGLARSLLHMANPLLRQGKVIEARDAELEALAIRSTLHDQGVSHSKKAMELADNHVRLGNTHYYLGYYTEALEYVDFAIRAAELALRELDEFSEYAVVAEQSQGQQEPVESDVEGGDGRVKLSVGRAEGGIVSAEIRETKSTLTSAQMIDQQRKEWSLVLARAQITRGDTASWMGYSSQEIDSLYELSSQILSEIAQTNPKDADIAFRLALVTSRVGNRAWEDQKRALSLYQQISATLESLMDIDPSNWDWGHNWAAALVLQGEAHSQLKEYEEAITIIDQALEKLIGLSGFDATNLDILDTIIWAQTSRCNVLMARGDDDLSACKAAASTADRLGEYVFINASVNSHVAWAYQASAAASTRLEDHEKSVELYQEAMGILEQRRHKDPNAASYLRELGSFHSYLANALERVGDEEAARSARLKESQYRDNALQSVPDNAMFQYDKWVEESNKGDREKQDKEFVKALATYREGLESIGRASALEPDSAFYRTQVFLAHRKIAELLSDTDWLAGAATAASEGYSGIIKALEAYGKSLAAITHANQLKPGDAANLNYQHQAYRDVGLFLAEVHHDTATDYFGASLNAIQQASQLRPESDYYLNQLYLAHDRIAKHHQAANKQDLAKLEFERALNAAQKAAELNPKDPVHHSNLHLVVTELGQLELDNNPASALSLFERAVVSMEEAVKLRPDYGYYFNQLYLAYDRIARAQQKNENWAQARLSFEKALAGAQRAADLESYDAVHHLNVGYVFRDLGNVTYSSGDEVTALTFYGSSLEALARGLNVATSDDVRVSIQINQADTYRAIYITDQAGQYEALVSLLEILESLRSDNRLPERWAVYYPDWRREYEEHPQT